MRNCDLVSGLAGKRVNGLKQNPHTRTPAHPQTKRGFTLIELLVTTAIVAVVSFAILSVLAGGINVYRRVQSYSDIRKDILLSLERVEKDLRNTCNISAIAFKGEEAKITFPALVNAAPDKNGGLSPGSLSYYIDGNTHHLVSEVKDFSAATAAESGKGQVTQLSYALSIKFSYYSYDPEAEAYLWSDTWEKEAGDNKPGVAASKLGSAEDLAKKNKIKVNTPLGVKIEIRYEDRGEPFVLDRTVFFPSAVSLRIAEAVAKKEEKNKKAGSGEKKG